MKSFSRFIISRYSWDAENLIATFFYSFDNEEEFIETIDFSPLKEQEYFKIKNNNIEEINTLLAHLHIALGVSYYKLFPTKDIVVETIKLDENQKNFWNTFYIKGLGEFFYRNQLDPRGLAIFKNNDKCSEYGKDIKFNADKLLVLFGGGKDSLVSVELLKENGEDFDLFSFGKNFELHEVAQGSTGKKRLIIKRNLDLQQINKLLDQGYYNGHLPITGIICFVSLVVGYLYRYKGVITSLERSADEGNTEYYNMEINHQWSKSKEFEKLFINYVKQYITESFYSKSLLRDWYEIKVVKEFSKYPQYYNSFSSCNRNFHLTGSQLSGKDLWCGICPKCGFVYTMLRAFIGKEKVNQIFDKDLFEDKELTQLFLELLGIDGIKPFECVGTNEEMVLAFWLILNQEPELNCEIMNIFKEKIVNKMSNDEFKKLEEKLGI